MVIRGRNPLRALLASLLVALDALLSAVYGDVRWCLLITARGRLSTSLGLVKHDRLVASGVLGGDVIWLLECVPEKVTTLALERTPRAAPLETLAVGLWFTAPALPPRQGPR
jgi:hypothetical protein